jgi:hypothetical protein
VLSRRRHPLGRKKMCGGQSSLLPKPTDSDIGRNFSTQAAGLDDTIPSSEPKPSAAVDEDQRQNCLPQ